MVLKCHNEVNGRGGQNSAFREAWSGYPLQLEHRAGLKSVRSSPKARLIRLSEMKIYSSISFLTPALEKSEWSAQGPCRFTPGTHCAEGWVGPRAPEAMERVPSSSYSHYCVPPYINLAA